MAKYKADDLNPLLPSFRKVVEKLLARMKELGYDPIPFDTLRTTAEAERNAAKGVGISNSIHLYGAAVDIICGKHGWSCTTKKCDFFRAMRREGLVMGLYRGPEADWPHLQGCPATKKAQDAIRALGAGDESAAARDALVAGWLRRAG